VTEVLEGRDVPEKHIRETIFPSPPYKESSNIARRSIDELRAVLPEYYAGDGKDDPVIIGLPEPAKEKRVKHQAGEAYKPYFAYNPNHEVSNLCRLGEHYLMEAFPHALFNALERFSEAQAVNPVHADAMLGSVLAFLPLLLCGYAPLDRIGEALKDMDLIARDVVKWQPHYWRAHAVLGAVLTLRLRLDEAIAAYDQALSLDRARTEEFPWFAVSIMTIGRPDDAEWRVLLNAKKLVSDPLARSIEGFLYYILRKFEPAKDVLEQALTLAPNYWFARVSMSLLCLALDRPDEALEHFHHAQSLTPDKWAVLPGFTYLYATKARKIPAIDRDFLRHVCRCSLEDGNPYVGLDRFQQALAHIADDDRDAAVHSLRSALKEGNPLVWWLHLWPILDPLRDYEPFTALMAEIKLNLPAPDHDLQPDEEEKSVLPSDEALQGE
jgi:tetratricopeptide (TPR) repeat protein